MATTPQRKQWSFREWVEDLLLDLRNWLDHQDDMVDSKAKSRAEMHQLRVEHHQMLVRHRLHHLLIYIVFAIALTGVSIIWSAQFDPWMMIVGAMVVGMLVGGALISFLHHKRKSNYHARCREHSSK